MKRLFNLLLPLVLCAPVSSTAQCDLEIVGFNPLSTALTVAVHHGHCGTEADSVGEFLLGVTFDPPLPDNPFTCMYQNGWAQLIFPLDFPGFNIGEGNDNILQSGDTVTFNLNEVPYFGSGTAQCWLEAMADGVYLEQSCVVLAVTQINDSESLTGSAGVGGFPYPDDNLWNNFLEFSLVDPWDQIGPGCDPPPPPVGEVPEHEPESDPCNDDVVYIPNAFTPNGDGINDVFQPVVAGDCWLWYRFQIFNRWGVKVFDSEHPGDIWRGENRSRWGLGKSYCQDGVYFWMLTGYKKSNHWVDLNGHVTLLR